MKHKLIVALDFAKIDKAKDLVDKLDPSVCALKVGSEMYTLFGPSFVRDLVARGYKVFLDLKFHDIPNTVARSVQAAADLGVWMLNVHAIGGSVMLRAASEALRDFSQHERPLLIAVTVLTSMSNAVLQEVGISNILDNQVGRLAKLAQDSGLDGVVASALEVPVIKNLCGNTFITVTPGIRGKTDIVHDQVRVITPQLAQELGSDYLVVGRPITQATDPLAAIRELFSYE